jgi:peptidoglycan/LPS O-acetylase OafA/YrhL
MGIRRLLLALSVLISHTNTIFGFGLVGGQAAVQAFFIISGFYMALILNEKYIGKNNSYKLFITNRLLRLYPIYFLILLLTIVASIAAYFYSSGHNLGRIQVYTENYDSINFSTLFYLFISNLTMLFQDIAMFLGLNIETGNLYFTTNFSQTEPQLFRFLMVPQAWTVSIEMTFYLIAPFIVRRKLGFILILIILSALLRIILYQSGLNNDPWTFRFYPTELLLFLMGVVGYHVYTKTKNTSISIQKIIFGFVLFATIGYSFISFQYQIIAYLVMFAICVPFIFNLSKNWQTDRFLGELSYPIYISHILIIMSVKFLKIPLLGGLGLVVAVFTIIISLLLNEFVSKKIESKRQNRVLSRNIN